MQLLTPDVLAGDPWVSPPEDAPVPEHGAVIVPLARLLAEGSMLASHPGPLGVRVTSGEDIATAGAMLARLALVVIHVPKFRDGRIYTTARTLRERFGFAGEIRAEGHLIPDQALFLYRAGVDAVVLPAGADTAVWRHALTTQTIAYQGAMRADGPLAGLKRRIGAPPAG